MARSIHRTQGSHVIRRPNRSESYEEPPSSPSSDLTRVKVLRESSLNQERNDQSFKKGSAFGQEHRISSHDRIENPSDVHMMDRRASHKSPARSRSSNIPRMQKGNGKKASPNKSLSYMQNDGIQRDASAEILASLSDSSRLKWTPGSKSFIMVDRTGESSYEGLDDEAHTRDRIILLPTRRARDLSRFHPRPSTSSTLPPLHGEMDISMLDDDDFNRGTTPPIEYESDHQIENYAPVIQQITTNSPKPSVAQTPQKKTKSPRKTLLTPAKDRFVPTSSPLAKQIDGEESELMDAEWNANDDMVLMTPLNAKAKDRPIGSESAKNTPKQKPASTTGPSSSPSNLRNVQSLRVADQESGNVNSSRLNDDQDANHGSDVLDRTVASRQNTPQQSLGSEQHTLQRSLGSKQNTPQQSMRSQQNTPQQSIRSQQNTPQQSIRSLQDTPQQSMRSQQNTPRQSMGSKHNTPQQNMINKENDPQQSTSSKQYTPQQHLESGHSTPQRITRSQQNTPRQSVLISEQGDATSPKRSTNLTPVQQKQRDGQSTPKATPLSTVSVPPASIRSESGSGRLRSIPQSHKTRSFLHDKPLRGHSKLLGKKIDIIPTPSPRRRLQSQALEEYRRSQSPRKGTPTNSSMVLTSPYHGSERDTPSVSPSKSLRDLLDSHYNKLGRGASASSPSIRNMIQDLSQDLLQEPTPIRPLRNVSGRISTPHPYRLHTLNELQEEQTAAAATEAEATPSAQRSLEKPLVTPDAHQSDASRLYERDLSTILAEDDSSSDHEADLSFDREAEVQERAAEKHVPRYRKSVGNIFDETQKPSTGGGDRTQSTITQHTSPSPIVERVSSPLKQLSSVNHNDLEDEQDHQDSQEEEDEDNVGYEQDSEAQDDEGELNDLREWSRQDAGALEPKENDANDFGDDWHTSARYEAQSEDDDEDEEDLEDESEDGVAGSEHYEESVDEEDQEEVAESEHYEESADEEDQEEEDIERRAGKTELNVVSEEEEERNAKAREAESVVLYEEEEEEEEDINTEPRASEPDAATEEEEEYNTEAREAMEVASEEEQDLLEEEMYEEEDEGLEEEMSEEEDEGLEEEMYEEEDERLEEREARNQEGRMFDDNHQYEDHSADEEQGYDHPADSDIDSREGSVPLDIDVADSPYAKEKDEMQEEESTHSEEEDWIEELDNQMSRHLSAPLADRHERYESESVGSDRINRIRDDESTPEELLDPDEIVEDPDASSEADVPLFDEERNQQEHDVRARQEAEFDVVEEPDEAEDAEPEFEGDQLDNGADEEAGSSSDQNHDDDIEDVYGARSVRTQTDLYRMRENESMHSELQRRPSSKTVRLSIPQQERYAKVSEWHSPLVRQRSRQSDQIGESSRSVLTRPADSSISRNKHRDSSSVLINESHGSITLANMMRHRVNMLASRPEMVEVTSMNYDAAARAAEVLRAYHKYVQYGSLEADLDEDTYNLTVLNGSQQERSITAISGKNRSNTLQSTEEVRTPRRSRRSGERHSIMDTAHSPAKPATPHSPASVIAITPLVPGAFPGSNNRHDRRSSHLQDNHERQRKQNVTSGMPDLTIFSEADWKRLIDVVDGRIEAQANSLREKGMIGKGEALLSAMENLNKLDITIEFLEENGIFDHVQLHEWSKKRLILRITVLLQNMKIRLKERYPHLDINVKSIGSVAETEDVTSPATPSHRNGTLDESGIAKSAERVPFKLMVASTPAKRRSHLREVTFADSSEADPQSIYPALPNAHKKRKPNAMDETETTRDNIGAEMASTSVADSSLASKSWTRQGFSMLGSIVDGIWSRGKNQTQQPITTIHDPIEEQGESDKTPMREAYENSNPISLSRKRNVPDEMVDRRKGMAASIPRRTLDDDLRARQANQQSAFQSRSSRHVDSNDESTRLSVRTGRVWQPPAVPSRLMDDSTNYPSNTSRSLTISRTPVRKIASGSSSYVHPTALSMLSPHTHAEARLKVNEFRDSRDGRRWRSPKPARDTTNTSFSRSSLNMYR